MVPIVELGYPSLWECLLRGLHYREGAAGRRIGAMRVLRRFPRLEAHSVPPLAKEAARGYDYFNVS